MIDVYIQTLPQHHKGWFQLNYTSLTGVNGTGIYACTAKPYDILKVIIAWVKSAYHVMEYTVCHLVKTDLISSIFIYPSLNTTLCPILHIFWPHSAFPQVTEDKDEVYPDHAINASRGASGMWLHQNITYTQMTHIYFVLAYLFLFDIYGLSMLSLSNDRKLQNRMSNE